MPLGICATTCRTIAVSSSEVRTTHFCVASKTLVRDWPANRTFQTSVISLSPSHRPSCISISTRRPLEQRRSHLIQQRPPPNHTRATHLDHLQLHRPLVLHVDGDHDLSACIVLNRQGHGLETGRRHGAVGESNRTGTDAPE